MTDRTMQIWWRRAVLRKHHNICAVCGRVKPDNELQAHHLVKRRYRLLRHDWRNGVPVCAGECHNYADTTTGTSEILGRHRYGPYLGDIVRTYRTVKDYLTEQGMALAAYDQRTLDELKTVASGGYREAS
jgi:hypothetical protein